METMDRLAREGDGRTVMISCEIDLGLDWLLEVIWQVSSIAHTAMGPSSLAGIGSSQVRCILPVQFAKLTKGCTPKSEECNLIYLILSA